MTWGIMQMVFFVELDSRPWQTCLILQLFSRNTGFTPENITQVKKIWFWDLIAKMWERCFSLSRSWKPLTDTLQELKKIKCFLLLIWKRSFSQFQVIAVFPLPFLCFWITTFCVMVPTYPGHILISLTSTLPMEAGGSSKTSAIIGKTTCCHQPEHRNLNNPTMKIWTLNTVINS